MLLCSFCSIAAYAQDFEPIALDKTNFDEDALITWLKNNADRNHNEFIDEDEFNDGNERLSKIDLSEQGISSLKGIGLITPLKELNCTDNNLQEVDLSSNVNLGILIINGNQLTSLDLSNNTLLERLVCSGNQLTSLDLSNNTMINWLECDYNQLTSLDLSNNTMIEMLDCGSNHLTSLDLSQHTKLWHLICNNQSVDLGTVSAAGFTIDGLDMSRVSIVSGGTIANGMFIPDNGSTEIKYIYDTKSAVAPSETSTFDVTLTFECDYTSTTPTAVDTVNAEKSGKTIKTIENGRVVIIRDGKKYDLSGREL